LTLSLYFSDDFIWFIALAPPNIPGAGKFFSEQFVARRS
jgi:hypothetical protein